MKFLHLTNEQFNYLYHLVQLSSCALDQGESVNDVIKEQRVSVIGAESLSEAVLDKLIEQI